MPLRVLLCDDSDGAVYMARMRIAELDGIEFVGDARDHTECLSAIVRTKPDVALVDHALVAYVTRSDVERLRAEVPGTALILYSAVADDIVAQEARALGLDGFLSKRATETEFEAAIRHHASPGDS